LADKSGYLIYKTGTSSTLHWFLVGSTTILFLIGAGLFSKAIGFFEYYTFAKGVGGDVAETGDGPGSFRVAGNVWHLTYGTSPVQIRRELIHQEIPRLEVLLPTEVGRFSTLFLAGVSHAQHVQVNKVLIDRQLRFPRYNPRICLLLAVLDRRSSIPQMARG
jgi:hypothetical protein